MVKTSIYDVNAKCTADTVYLRVRIILCNLILFLSELDKTEPKPEIKW